jgi:hypothetical protein
MAGMDEPVRSLSSAMAFFTITAYVGFDDVGRADSVLDFVAGMARAMAIFGRAWSSGAVVTETSLRKRAADVGTSGAAGNGESLQSVVDGAKKSRRCF